LRGFGGDKGFHPHGLDKVGIQLFGHYWSLRLFRQNKRGVSMKFPAYFVLAVLSIAAVPCSHAQSSGFSDDDKKFLKDSAQDNLAEIKMAQLAVKTSKNPTVTAFAQKMITDHHALLAGAKPVALKAGVTPPTSPSLGADAEYAKLKVLSGDTFDNSYIKTMVSDHHDDLSKVKAEHDSTQNDSMKKLTAHASTVIAGHTEMIDGIAGKMGLQ
jgi:putative membrane protein